MQRPRSASRGDDAPKTAGADINAVDVVRHAAPRLACKLQITEVAERLIGAPGIDLARRDSGAASRR